MNMNRLTLSLLLAPMLAACQPPLEKRQGPTMGSTWHISYVRDGRAPKAEQVQIEVQQLLDAMDKAVSTYRNDSDVARFNAAPAGTCMTMPPIVTSTLAPYAQQLHRESEGAFDITLLPALDAWGFGPKAAAQKAKTALQPGAHINEILKAQAPDAPGTSPHTVSAPPSGSNAGAGADPDT
ncbi:MAG: FAD:protein FMN transferase, partial [Lautropia sp.]|nr:FAD:protein FMN transferase [Lautropia sp.]